MAIDTRIVVLLAGLASAFSLWGCSFHRPIRIGEDTAASWSEPTPAAATAIEYGVRTVRLQYGLPGRSAAPTMISFQRISITDEVGRPCPVVSTNWGKAAEFWASISFTAPQESNTITANFTLSLDNTDYPLTARLTRIDATRWRVDYGIR